MALFWFLLLVAVVLGFIGVLAEGMLFMLFTGILVALADVVYAGLRIRRGGRRPVR
ncbi:hypothetical protein SZN_17357 [Streptomyces zinciresistens K42]|uniref:Uncharacterized protein n=1 Tax=Streptomyces zinciresistens K42 TaxID=700597 RepID=G2GD94_9ACTN|nr:hypothetical protein [Streptomyces zinciresistens]EGX58493.1 hypothetical protein SZN_17357 [Streptomyces zinciresistens K42]